MHRMIDFLRDDWMTLLLYMFSAIAVSLFCYRGSLMNERSGSGSRRWNRYYICAFMWLVLLATVRNSNVGSDIEFYVEYFENKIEFRYDWSRFFSFYQYEPGFQAWFWLIRKISDNYRVMFLLTYSFVAYAYIAFFKEMFDSKNGIIFMQVFIFYFSGNMSGVRAAIGMSFVFLATIALKDERYCKSVVLTIAGMMFHYTMIYNLYIILAAFLLRKVSIWQKKLWWTSLIILAIGLSGVLLNIFQKVFTGTKYDFYFVDASELSFTGSMIYLFFAIACILYFIDIESKGKESKISLIVSMSFLVTYPVLFLLGAYRIPYYYVPVRLKVWGDIEQEFEKHFTYESAKVVRIMCQILIWLYLIYRFFKSYLDGDFTYQIL